MVTLGLILLLESSLDQFDHIDNHRYFQIRHFSSPLRVSFLSVSDGVLFCYPKSSLRELLPMMEQGRFVILVVQIEVKKNLRPAH